MDIQINTDRNTDGRERVAEYVRGIVEEAVGHFSNEVTRVEVHLGDENGARPGPDDKRCMMEARIAKRQPVAVTHHGASMNEAIDGAAGKLKRSLEHQLYKRREHRP